MARGNWRGKFWQGKLDHLSRTLFTRMLGGSGKRFGPGKRWGTAKRWVLLALILGLSGAVLFGVPGRPGLAGGPGVALARGTPAGPGLALEESVIEVQPVAVHAGGNTDPGFPARHLIDSDATSFWQTTATTPGQAWFSLELDRPYRIETIELTGLGGPAGATGNPTGNPGGNPAGQVAAADFAVQYESGGFWHTFTGRGHVDGHSLSQGSLRIDLSYNQAIASKLRLVFANPRNAPRLGGITNIRVWGSQPIAKTTRLNPVNVTQSANTLPNHPGADLADGNTYTGWQASPLWPLWPASGWNQPGWVVLDLGRPYEIDQVRLFGQAGGSEQAGGGSGRFAVEYETGGIWQPFSGLGGVDNASLGSRWSRLDFSAQRIVTSRVRVYIPADPNQPFKLPADLLKELQKHQIWLNPDQPFKFPADLQEFLEMLEDLKLEDHQENHQEGHDLEAPQWFPRLFGPAEVELWGREADGGTVAASRLGLAPQGPSVWLGAGAVFAATVELPGDLALNTYTQARLHYEVENLTAATQLFRRVNGGKYLPVKAAPRDGRWQAVSETMDVAELRSGKNFVNFRVAPAAAGGTASPLRVDNLQLELIRADGRIQPVAIEGSPETDPAYPAANLTDGRAGTAWQSRNTWPAQAQVELDLGTGYLLDRLEFLPVAGSNRDLTVEYLPAEPATSLPGALPGPGGPANRPDANNQENWQPLPGASHLDLGLFGEGWVSLDLTGEAGVGQTGATQPVVAQKLRLVFVNTDGQALPAALREIRLWGSRVNTAPRVWILSPTEGEFLKDDEAVVSGKVDNPLFQVTVNGKSKHVTRLDNLFAARIALKKEKEQEEDGEEISHPKPHPWRATITAMATDSLGREGSDTVTVYPDVNEDKIPIPVITAPKEGATLVAASVAVTVTVPKDDGPVMVYVNGVQATELKGPEDDGDHKDQREPQAPKSQEGQKDTEGYPDKEGSRDKEGSKVRTFTAQVPLEEGLNRLAATVVTQKGYQRTGAITVFNDILPPVVRPNTPLAGDVLADSALTVRGLAGDTTQVGVQVNGLPAALSEGIFSTSLNLVEGPNLLTITATDAFKRATTQQFKVMVDSQPPVVRIGFPVREVILTAEPVTVTGSVQDAIPTSVFVNGVTATVGGTLGEGGFAAQVRLLEGWNTLRAVAFDAAEHPASDTLQVLLDTQPPRPFVPVADPAGWTPVPTPIITFATTDVTSGMDHYELKMDDGVYVTVLSPYTLPLLADGIHAITVKAVDRAGWETFGSVKVYIDATPPAAFTPVANPAGWTSQTTPAITFATTDATSGIDHYELKVGNEAFAVVTSPHTLPAQPDGEQVVTVRAVDKAGNVTDGQVKIYIDTIPPGLPTGLELIPGPDSITAKWQPNPEEDVTHYVLRREPTFSDGTATRIITKEQGASYKDLDVTPGSSYAYQLQAVDHAQNASPFTLPVQARAGMTITPVDSASGGTVKYENVQLEIPQGALPQSTLVTVVTVSPESTPPVSNAANVRVGPAYNFAVTDSPDQITNGRQVEFAQPVTVSLNFREAEIPAGYTAANLYVYTYDEVLGSWVRLPRLKLDLANKTITTQTQHFSMYGIQATASNPLSPEDYKDLGVAPYQTYFRDNTETVSPSSGGLTVEATDLVLPGRNGHDLKIIRIYDSLAADAAYRDGDKRLINSFGRGWSLDLPGLETNDHGQYLKLPKGATYQVKWVGDREYLYFEQHEGEHFRLEQIRHKTGEHEVRLFGFIYLYTVEDWATDSYRLVLKDGTQYLFNTEGKVAEIVDRTGNNRIRIEYAGRNLTRMVDTLGREVKFVYSGDKIATITGGGKQVAYSYDGANLVAVTYTDTGENQSLVPHAQDRVTRYGYTPVTVTYGEEVTREGEKINGIKTRTSLYLNSITYPSGGASYYSYGVTPAAYFQSEYTWRGYRMYISGRYKVSGGPNNQQFENTSFSYTVETQDSKSLLRLHSAVMDEPSRRTEYSFTEKSLVASKLVRDLTQGGLAVEKTDYQYHETLKLPTVATIYKGNAPQGLAHAYDLNYAYDGWGNQTYEYNGATGLATWWGYANSSTDNLQAAAPGRGFAAPPFGSGISGIIHDLVTARGSVNYNPTTGATQIVQSQYQYDSSGNLLAEARLHNGGWITTSYAYDQYGNMVQKVDPDGRTTVVEYSPTYAYAYPTKVTVQNVVDADGLNTGDVVSEYGYDFLTGLKTWERNGRGYVTTYAYDKYNRLRRTVFPDEDDGSLRPGEAGWDAARANNPLKQADFDDVLNTYTVTDEEGRRVLFQYDGLGHLLSVTQYQRGGSPGAYTYDPYAVTSFGYDTAGNVVAMTDANGRITTYAYDGLGRNVRVNYADATPETWDNPNSQTSYDDLWRTVTLIDPNGRQTIQHKDWAGRIVQVDQYETATGQIFRSYAAYDRLGQKVQVTDGRGAVTRLTYDDLGRLMETVYPAVPLVKPGAGWEITESPKVTYAYDNAGNKIAETSALGNAQDGVDRARFTTTYAYDALSRLVKTTEPFTQVDDQGTSQLYQRVTKTYYDAAGNKVKVVDGNGHATTYNYDARNRLVAETDALGNTTTYAYDQAGNKIRTTDPRGNATPAVAGDYTTWYRYDDLNRLIQAILPDNTPPVDPFANPEGNPTVAFTYDRVGNKLTEQDPNGNITKFTYTERYWLKAVEDAAGHQTSFGYDRAGNQISITDARQNTTKNVYDDLNRVMETIDPEYHHRFFYYDAVGNRTKVVDSNYNKTEYTYNGLNKLTAVADAVQGITRYQYDPNGNLVATVDARGNVTTYAYNELNWLMKEVQEANGAQRTTIYRYDLAGNRKAAVDPRGVPAVYAYLANNLLESVTWGPGRPDGVQIGYTYDPSGNRVGMSDPSGSTAYTYDPLNQLIEVVKAIQGTTYTTGYAYDRAGNLTGIKYPNGSQWLAYSYNNLNQLIGVGGFATGDVSNPAFTYDAAGNLASMRYDNGVTTAYTLDKLNRRTQIEATAPNLPSPVLALNFRFDGEGNILQRNDNLYSYDALDRLQAAQVKGIFHEETGGQPGYVSGDLLGKKSINTTLDPGTVVGLDYGSSSIGLDFGRQVAGVDTIHLKKDQPGSTYRVNKKALELLYSNDNITYTKVADSTWKFIDDGKGNYTLTLDAPIDAQVVKVHNRYDDRDEDLGFTDQAQFKNTLGKTISAEQKLNQATLEYVYDAVGNRVEERFTQATTQTTLYTYYLNSNRLLTNGKYAFVYDANGNLLKKGNTFTIGTGQQVTFTTSGKGVEYWEYGYDLRNQLVQVTKNGQVVGSYSYNGEGLRVAGTSGGISRHYIFDPAGRVIYETRVDGGSGGSSTNPTIPPDTSYVFAFGQHLAKVAGAIGGNGEISYYHNDHLGSPMAMTDKTGKVIWSQDYLPYGLDLNENAQGGDTRFKFTGKEHDRATGLYYFNARWYDSELGRFISEDPKEDPNNPNIYAYCADNPLKYTDPMGEAILIEGDPTRNDALVVVADKNSDSGYLIVRGGDEYPNQVSKDVANTLYTGDTRWIERSERTLSASGSKNRTFEAVGLRNEIKAHLDPDFGKTWGLIAALLGPIDLSKKGAAPGLPGDKFGSGANSAGQEFKGVKVIGEVDIDWKMVDGKGRTNLQRAQNGLAPLGKDGNPINLHHVGQSNRGPVIELEASSHQANSISLHTKSGPSEIDRAAFAKWRTDYWKWRAKQALGGDDQ